MTNPKSIYAVDMSVVDFRPHTFNHQLGCSVQKNEDGDVVKSEVKYSADIPCNAVPSNGRATIKDAEGVSVEYSFVIYADNVPVLNYGSIIRLFRDGVLFILTVKGYYRYKNFTKIWV